MEDDSMVKVIDEFNIIGKTYIQMISTCRAKVPL